MSNNNIGCLGFILKLFGLLPKQPEELPYGLNSSFVTRAELNFYKALVEAVEDRVMICPKIRLGDIFSVKDSSSNLTYRNKIDRKHVDFLLCDKEKLKPLAGIELDDRSHLREDRRRRDEFVERVFETAGLPLIRITNSYDYDVEDIKEELAIVFDLAEEEDDEEEDDTPLCPRCKVPMVLRTARKGERAGEEFYGCANFPRCREIIRKEER